MARVNSQRGTDRREFGGMGIARRIMSCRNSPMIRILLELLRGQRSSARNEKWGWICEWEWERERVRVCTSRVGALLCFNLTRSRSSLVSLAARVDSLFAYFAQVPEELEWEEPSLVSDAQHPLCLFLPRFDFQPVCWIIKISFHSHSLIMQVW